MGEALLGKTSLRPNSVWLHSAFLIALALIAPNVPIWGTAFAVCFWIWRWVLERSAHSTLLLPSRWLTSALSVLLLLYARLYFGGFFSPEISSVLFIGLGSLKILEYRTDNDRVVARFLVLFSIAAGFIFSIEIWNLVPAVLGTFLVFLDVRDAEWSDRYAESKIILRAWIMALPLSLVLFVLFPRIESPFGSTQRNSSTAFSAELSPGRVSSLASSNHPVMRVTWQRKAPPITGMYWVGVRLYQSEGLNWTRGKQDRSAATRGKPLFELPLDGGDFTSILEPSAGGFLFAPEGTQNVFSEAEVYSTFDRAWFSNRVQTGRIRYLGSLESPFRATSDKWRLSDAEAERASWLQLPEFTKTAEDRLEKEFGFLKEKSSPRAKVEGVIAWMAERGFRYSVNPGTSSSSLTAFLFESRKGFCEHYAGAFATILRWLGVKSRVAVGYQGGVWNEAGKFFLIADRDAHAWIEYVDGSAVERLDLVGYVAPERLVAGARDFFDGFDESSGEFHPRDDRIAGLANAWREIASALDALNYRWITFLLDFDLEQQKRLLAESRGALFWVFIGVALLGLTRSLRASHRAKQSESWESRSLRRLMEVSVRKGWLAADYEYTGPMDLMKALQQSMPQAAVRMAEMVVNSYSDHVLRCQPSPSNQRPSVERSLRALSRTKKSNPEHRGIF